MENTLKTCVVMDRAITDPATRPAKEIQQTVDNIHGRNTIHESIALCLVFHPKMRQNPSPTIKAERTPRREGFKGK
ncbi:hypothetical protein FOXB_17276 [Fusarium oxysporum f. sp. conglutinans Fo5176]|uniref:Uncharacterized protein n=1 Tax=Fusarium oxysporum (strain Fo5176) TaxID=660025 RepID=F9GF42_FUSOF|nr:hypothetical protein FOXB_17276 [Fusarium oxysporum f. sp. conglutinans Fo5176]